MSKYHSLFQEAKAAYDHLDTINIDGSIATLDSALVLYGKNPTDGNRRAVETAFLPISEYYAKLLDINTNLQDFLNKATTNVAESQGRLLNEERYDNKVHPEESIQSREIMIGIVPTLRPRSIPYIMAASVAMSVISIFIIFQMNGMSGQVNLPPAIVTWWSTPSTFSFRDPMVLSGLLMVALAGMTIFGVLYYRSRNTNK